MRTTTGCGCWMSWATSAAPVPTARPGVANHIRLLAVGFRASALLLGMDCKTQKKTHLDVFGSCILMLTEKQVNQTGFVGGERHPQQWDSGVRAPTRQ
ncbi:uncharacterized protein LOC120355804 isoform X3 [Nilaparvata lugens]|uniref:uncharacterized protein LOC120355804 isoform X3 n=1 Tax=Nilaparvata lugens TaxID=108931 RepID=UPI00193D7E05|nr:uncharacterized protein LOC120355804 isoform X3 [Nilaparvata lugens]XP_039300447.1 uncharacterized protein LOC120355804 isoform X3 [Nilaparvata lugens]XP_039300448.1 uncharacterized protein LOC120355804 isoform X3 [Nilaparvata lugens]XP_039300449.1 uncharacterized protein LOC120355804 isoform X3 [Nilaparvata lugens]XP_039300450.1 uncharacterized protein LOC120355804 isoform X3 [Nilaparvata lugens]XP_039300451.1 uncharacterized protein LOC120355804 isoform X3 [Nilaparvata lugens]